MSQSKDLNDVDANTNNSDQTTINRRIQKIKDLKQTTHIKFKTNLLVVPLAVLLVVLMVVQRAVLMAS